MEGNGKERAWGEEGEKGEEGEGGKTGRGRVPLGLLGKIVSTGVPAGREQGRDGERETLLRIHG